MEICLILDLSEIGGRGSFLLFLENQMAKQKPSDCPSVFLPRPKRLRIQGPLPLRVSPKSLAQLVVCLFALLFLKEEAKVQGGQLTT